MNAFACENAWNEDEKRVLYYSANSAFCYGYIESKLMLSSHLKDLLRMNRTEAWTTYFVLRVPFISQLLSNIRLPKMKRGEERWKSSCIKTNLMPRMWCRCGRCSVQTHHFLYVFALRQKQKRAFNPSCKCKWWLERKRTLDKYVHELINMTWIAIK